MPLSGHDDLTPTASEVLGVAEHTAGFSTGAGMNREAHVITNTRCALRAHCQGDSFDELYLTVRGDLHDHLGFAARSVSAYLAEIYVRTLLRGDAVADNFSNPGLDRGHPARRGGCRCRHRSATS